MNERVKCEINSVEIYKKDIIKYYKMQIVHFKNLKQKFSRVVWQDERFLENIDKINICLEKIADAINNLSDGHHTKIIDSFLEEALDYINTRSHYPK